MLAHIRRHQRWLWGVIATLTIISFVYFLDPSTGRRGGGRSIFSGGPSDYGYFNGRAITAEEYEQMKQEARLEYLFSSGRWPEEVEGGQQFFNLAVQVPRRLLFAEKLNELNIQVSDEIVAGWIAHAFRDHRSGAFHVEFYQQFLKTTLPRGRVSESEFRMFVRHQAGLEQLISLAGLTGSLVTPREAEAVCRQENEQLSTEAVFFSASNYLASVQVPPAALAEFYTNHLSEYRIPDRVQVSYVKFEITNYLAEADQALAQITNLTQQLERFYQQRGADFYKDADGKTMPHDAAIQKIKEEQRRAFAMTSARKKGTEFMEQLYELYQKQPNQSDNLDKLAAATGYQSGVTEPFTQRDGPRDLKVLDTFTQVAFALSPEQPMPSDPLPGEDGVYVITLKKRIPSEAPPLEAVREKVTAEFRQHEATDAARKAGEAFYGTLTNGFAQNKSFEVVCLEANVISHKLPPFSLSTRSLPQEWEGRVDLSLLKDLAFPLTPGKTSRFEMTRDGRLGMTVHLLSRQPVDEAKLKAELPEVTTGLREERRREAINDWMRREFESAHFTGGPLQKKTGSR